MDHVNEVSAQDVLDFLRHHPEDVCKALLHEHRTNQQRVADGIATVIKSLATHDTDMRNEASVSWAKKVCQIYANFPFI